MVTYLKDGQDFGSQHFSRDFGFTRSADVPRLASGGRVRRADGGAMIPGPPPAAPMRPPMAGGPPMGGGAPGGPPGMSDPMSDPLAHATVTMPAADMSKLAAGAVKLGAQQAVGTLAKVNQARAGGMPPGGMPPPPMPQGAVPAMARGGRVRFKDGGRVAAPKAAPKSAGKGTSTSSDVRSPTSTDVRSPTKTSTSTDAYTADNLTVTGGAGDGDTIVNVSGKPSSPQQATARAKDHRKNPATGKG